MFATQGRGPLTSALIESLSASGHLFSFHLCSPSCPAGPGHRAAHVHGPRGWEPVSLTPWAGVQWSLLCGVGKVKTPVL